jgi:hypothetical protein
MGVSMSYFRRVVKRRPARLTDSEWLEVWERGKLPREHFRPRDGCGDPPARIDRILCWWCRDFHSPDEVAACMALPRPVVANGQDLHSTLSAKIPPWLSQFPELWEFLSRPSYKDGAPRTVGKITLGLSSDGIQVTLTDPSSSAYCSRHYPSLEDALLALEVGLSENSLTWRASGPQRGKSRR